MQSNFIRILFIVIAASTAIFGLLINYVESYLPSTLTSTYRYGKFSANTYKPIVAKTEVPKRWFKHFYMFAAPASSYVLYLVLHKYLLNGDIPKTVTWILNMSLGTNRQPLVSPESTFLASVLFCLQCCKRLYETTCVNIFSDKMMNLVHYFMGFCHYIGVLLCVIGESKGFSGDSNGTIAWNRITYIQLLCAVIFILASYTQLKANYTLRNLRKDKDDKINFKVYKIPHNGLFKYVSGALQSTEILMYLTASIILWQSSTYHYVTIWVLVNQTSTAMLTHQWYIQTFKNYPKSRKVLVPYIF